LAAPSVSLVEATPEHAEALAPQMRLEDEAEVVASGFADAREALLVSLAGSLAAYALLFDGEVAALFGVAPLDETLLGTSSSGVAWVLTGRAATRHRKAFVRWSRPALALLLRERHHLVNMVDARYAAALRWARWLGFRIGEPEPFGPHGHLFCPISIRRSQWAH
jgi:hypothetical protein